MLFRLGVNCDDIVHGLQGVGAEEHLATLCTDLCRDVAKDAQLSVPAVDMLDAAFADWTVAGMTVA